MTTTIPYEQWIKTVRQLLLSIGYRKDISLSHCWKSLYDDGLGPFDAVMVSELDTTKRSQLMKLIYIKKKQNEH